MIEVNRLILDNGLRVIHSGDTSTQMVTLNLLYKVGSRNEHPEHTGFAHLFEHLMFGGSVHIPNYDAPLQTAGGTNNAYTTNDYTNYYLTIPAGNVETGFWLESDRMLGLAFTPQSLEVQRMVVCEEFKQNYLNRPYGDLAHLTRGLAFQVHPYRWPTIGKELEHIKKATLDDVKEFFYHYYAPNNAILSITGNLLKEEAFRLAEKWFGDIPYRKGIEQVIPQEPEQIEERRLTVERKVPVDFLYMAFPMVHRLHPDFYVYDMLSDLLANGNSSRLISRLVKERSVFSAVDATISGCLDAGLLQINGQPQQGVSMEEAEAAVWQELESLKEDLIADFELEKVKNKYESMRLLDNLNTQDLAANLAYFEFIGKAENINEEVLRYREVTPGDIRRVARDVFQHRKCNTVYYLAKL